MCILDPPGMSLVASESRSLWALFLNYIFNSKTSFLRMRVFHRMLTRTVWHSEVSIHVMKIDPLSDKKAS